MTGSAGRLAASQLLRMSTCIGHNRPRLKSRLGSGITSWRKDVDTNDWDLRVKGCTWLALQGSHGQVEGLVPIRLQWGPLSTQLYCRNGPVCLIRCHTVKPTDRGCDASVLLHQAEQAHAHQLTAKQLVVAKAITVCDCCREVTYAAQVAKTARQADTHSSTNYLTLRYTLT